LRPFVSGIVVPLDGLSAMPEIDSGLAIGSSGRARSHGFVICPTSGPANSGHPFVEHHLNSLFYDCKIAQLGDNIRLLGPPGSGKAGIAKRIPSKGNDHRDRTTRAAAYRRNAALNRWTECHAVLLILSMANNLSCTPLSGKGLYSGASIR
jgi:hypothetical protein